MSISGLRTVNCTTKAGPITGITAAAAVDIGSRNVKLVVGDWIDGTVVVRSKHKSALNLGDEVAARGRIGSAKLGELRDVLVAYRARCERLGASLIGAVATSAVRNARNRSDVVALADELGIPLEVVSGERETALAYLAATGGQADCLVSDLGSRSGGIAWKLKSSIDSRSSELGHTTVYRRYFEPAAAWSEAENAFRRELALCFPDIPSQTKRYIALSGKNAAGFVSGCDKEATIGTVLKADRVHARIDDLRQLPPTGVKQLLGGIDRGKKIGPALVFIDFVMERSGHRDVLIQDNELPVGLIVERFLTEPR